MGPPAYSRSLTSQPYPARGGRRERRESRDAPALSIPNFSDLTNTFEVEIQRNSLGLGFSICGGPDAAPPWTHLIRIKKVFPLQPAWETSKLRVGDILLKVSGIPLTGLHLRQALDILRTSPPLTLLQVCRVAEPPSPWAGQGPPRSRSSVVRSYSTGQQEPRPYSPPTLTKNNTSLLSSLQQQPDNSTSLLQDGSLEEDRSVEEDNLGQQDKMDIEVSPPSPSPPTSREWSPEEDSTMSLLQPVETALRNSRSAVGQFTISLTKVCGSLGFTLRQLDDTVLKHTIKALVKEPALSDGRLQPGDKLLAANGVELASFSHQEVVQFLRQCPDTVSLELYRDASRSQTPLSPEQSLFDTLVCRSLSQEHRRSKLGTTSPRTSQSPSRKHLRYEAAELVRSLQSSRTSLERAGLGGSSNPGSYSSSGTLGRRLGRPYSPALRERKEMLVTSSPAPTVESPLSPHNSSAPASLSQGVAKALQGLHLEEQAGLLIEEIEGPGSPGSPQTFGRESAPTSPPQSPHSFLITPEPEYHKPERPSELDFSRQNKRQGFVFNHNWNLNKF